MARYKYTCPDVIHYRRNQYRALVWSNIFSIVGTAAFWGGLIAYGNKLKKAEPVQSPTEIVE